MDATEIEIIGPDEAASPSPKAMPTMASPSDETGTPIGF
jgi:hypothetical protein